MAEQKKEKKNIFSRFFSWLIGIFTGKNNSGVDKKLSEDVEAIERGENGGNTKTGNSSELDAIYKDAGLKKAPSEDTKVKDETEPAKAEVETSEKTEEAAEPEK